MGFLKFIGKKIVKSTAEVGFSFAAIKTVDTLKEKIEKNNKRKTTDFFCEKQNNVKKFVLTQDKKKINETFNILDENGCVKYFVRGNFFSIKHDLLLYSAYEKKKIGSVKEQLVSIRFPLSCEKTPKDFMIWLGNRMIGKIKSRYSVSKQKFICSFNEKWKIVGNFTGSNFKLLEGKNVLMEIKKQIAIYEDLYFIDIYSNYQEELFLLIALAIDCSLCSKIEDNENAIKRKIF